MKTNERAEYLKSVVEQHFSNAKTKPTEKGVRMLQEGCRKTFSQIMEEMETMKRPADKACALLLATEKARGGIEVATLCKKVGEQKKADKIINIIDVALPNSKIAGVVTREASHEFFTNVVRTSNELAKKAKELRMIVKNLV